MNSTRNKLVLSVLCLLSFVFYSQVICQTNDTSSKGGKKYDEIIDLNSLESIKVKKEEEKIQEQDELATFLPKLDSKLYEGWSLQGEANVWEINSDAACPLTVSKELLGELGLEKILLQSYAKENHNARVLIYKFKDFAGAYNAYTILHNGTATKLKVGKNASESEKSVNFWKGNYFADISTEQENDSLSKEFIILISQEISNNIKTDQLPPVVAIQLPALNRIQDSEKYCLGPICFQSFFSSKIKDFKPDDFHLNESGGIITAEYKFSEDIKDKEKITLVLVRYKNKETASSVFKILKSGFESKKSENKDLDIDVDLDDTLVKVKNKKNDYTMLKQRGNLLAIAYDITNKKSGEKVLGLVPWPIEIDKPLKGLDDK